MKSIANPVNLHAFAWVVINSSGGKDSQAALSAVVKLADEQGFDRAKIVVSHQDLKTMEWKGTRELAQQQAEALGLRFEVSTYRNKEGIEGDLLDYVRRRGKWPSNQQRYCTSDFKRNPGRRVVTALSRERGGDVLHVFGFRAEESNARAKRPVLSENKGLTTKTRKVTDWLPIHDWTVSDVWAAIEESGIPSHPAYKLGMPRLSCVFCILAPKAALIIAGRNNPELLDRYCETESAIGHRFTEKLSINEVRDAVRAGETVGELSDKWNM